MGEIGFFVLGWYLCSLLFFTSHQGGSFLLFAVLGVRSQFDLTFVDEQFNLGISPLRFGSTATMLSLVAVPVPFG